MKDRAALLAAIADEPDDDAPRLIYADWLDEQGEYARAEFIRIQCALAALSAADERRCVLETRAADLLTDHEQTWLSEAQIGEHCGEFRWSRGFLDSLRIRSNCVRESGPTIARREPLARFDVIDDGEMMLEAACAGLWQAGLGRRIGLVGSRRAQNVALHGFFTILDQPPDHLQELKLCDSWHEGGSHYLASVLTESLLCRSVRSFALPNCTGTSSPPLALAQIVRGFAQLRDLHFLDWGLNDEINTLQRHGLPERLRSLICRLEPGGERAFADAHWPALRELDIINPGGGLLPRLLDRSWPPNLKKLAVFSDYREIRDYNWGEFAARAALPNLEELTLGGVLPTLPLDPDEVVRLPSLGSLSVHIAPLTLVPGAEMPLTWLPHVPWLNHLTRLRLVLPVTNARIHDLRQILQRTAPRLTHLSMHLLGFNRTSMEVRQILRHIHFPHLTELSVRGLTWDEAMCDYWFDPGRCPNVRRLVLSARDLARPSLPTKSIIQRLRELEITDFGFHERGTDAFRELCQATGERTRIIVRVVEGRWWQGTFHEMHALFTLQTQLGTRLIVDWPYVDPTQT